MATLWEDPHPFFILVELRRSFPLVIAVVASSSLTFTFHLARLTLISTIAQESEREGRENWKHFVRKLHQFRTVESY